MRITDALTTEHAVFLRVFDHIEGELPHLRSLDQVRILAKLVEALLEGHGRAETELAYVALDHVLDDRGELDRLHQDHQEIDRCLRHAQKAIALAEARRLLVAALRVTREHFRREEQSIFPFIERVLHADTLTGLGQAWRQSAPAPAARA